MSYIGNSPISAAFLTDTFSGTGSQTAYTMTVAPANTSSMGIKLFRGATDLGKLIDQANYGGGNVFCVSFNYYDSPSSTSALVYKTQFNSEGAVGTITVQLNSYPSTITLMEISA